MLPSRGSPPNAGASRFSPRLAHFSGFDAAETFCCFRGKCLVLSTKAWWRKTHGEKEERCVTESQREQKAEFSQTKNPRQGLSKRRLRMELFIGCGLRPTRLEDDGVLSPRLAEVWDSDFLGMDFLGEAWSKGGKGCKRGFRGCDFLGLPYWGPYDKGILLLGGLYQGSKGVQKGKVYGMPGVAAATLRVRGTPQGRPRAPPRTITDVRITAGKPLKSQAAHAAPKLRKAAQAAQAAQALDARPCVRTLCCHSNQ